MATVQTQSRDTGHRRWADAARPHAVALERFAGFNRQHFYTLAVHLPEGTSIYSEIASRAARLMVETVFGAAPARWKLEQGRGGGLHIHVVSPLPPVAVAEFADCREVWGLRGLLAYLSKPGKAELCQSAMKHWGPDTGTRRREMFDALDEQAAARRARLARGKSRLPPVTGWTGTRTKAVQKHSVHVSLRIMALSVLALAYLLAVSTSPRLVPNSIPTPARREPSRPAQRRHKARPRAPDRSLCGLPL